MEIQRERVADLRRLLSALLTIVILSAVVPYSFAEQDDNDFDFSTPYILLMDVKSGAVLYEKEGYKKTYPASTTKIMTCILALESGKMDETITAEKFKRGSYMGLSNGEELPLRDLVYGLMLVSGNDCALAIANYLGGSLEGFAEMMNNKAKEIGMSDTHFITPHGMHDEGHQSTAYDMALLTRYAMQNPEFRSIVATKEYQVPPTNKDADGYLLKNSNRLLLQHENEDSFVYKYANGVKTGDTIEAGRCLVASAQKDGMELICVLFGDYENKVSVNYRYVNAAKLFDWGFANCASMSVSELEIPTEISVSVEGAGADDTGNAQLILKADLTNAFLAGTKQYLDAIKADCKAITMSHALTSQKITAPVKSGDPLGTASYQYNGKTIFTAPLIASRDVTAASSLDQPGGTPLVDGKKQPQSPGNSLVFWLLVAVIILIIVIILRLLVTRRARKYRRGRRKSYYVYRKR